MSKCKFKVGDVVIGNSYNYPLTGKGWVGKVTKVYDNGKFDARGKDRLTDLDFRFLNLDPKDFNLYIKDQPTKIVITTDGKTTTAKMYRDKQLVEVQTTKCHPDDRFDFKVGARVAFDRLVGEKKEEPKYYNGKVVCVKTRVPCGLRNGKIYTFIDGTATNEWGGQVTSGRVIDFNDLVSRFPTVDWLEVVE